MRRLPLGDVVEVNPRIPQLLRNASGDRRVSFLSMSSVTEEGGLAEIQERAMGDVVKGYTYFERGDILVAKITPCFENGKAVFLDRLPHAIGFGSTEFHVLRPSSEVDPRYLFYAVWNPAFRYVGKRNMTGTAGQKRVPADFVKRFKIPFPPLAEQRRIAAMLDKADAIRRKRREAIGLLDEFLRSAFLELVGPGNHDHEEWPEHRIEDLADSNDDSLRTGPFGSSLKHSEFIDEGVAVIGIDNAVQNRFAWDERRFIAPQKYEEFRRYTVRPGDVIVTIMGTTGRSAVIPEDIPLAISTKHLAVITANRDLIEPEYLSHAMHMHPGIRAQVIAANRGAIMSGLNLGIIRRLKVRLPPLGAQRRFASAVDESRRAADRMRDAQAIADDLFNSLAQRAFGD